MFCGEGSQLLGKSSCILLMVPATPPTIAVLRWCVLLAIKNTRALCLQQICDKKERKHARRESLFMLPRFVEVHVVFFRRSGTTTVVSCLLRMLEQPARMHAGKWLKRTSAVGTCVCA